VFIVGAARSGTTLLYRMLQHHPSFALHPRRPISGVVHLVESNVLFYIYRDDAPPGRVPLTVCEFMMFDPTGLRVFAQAVEATRAFRGAARRLPAALRETRVPSALALRDDLLRIFLHYSQVARGSRRVVEKTPGTTSFLGDIHRALPHSKTLFVARHPVDVLTSYWRRFQYEPSATWANIPVDEFCEVYEAETSRAVQYASRHPDRLRIVRYDALTASPETAADSICSFLGETFAPQMLDFSNELRKGRDPLHANEVVGRTKDWQDYISTDVVARVEATLAASMKALGFPSYASVS